MVRTDRGPQAAVSLGASVCLLLGLAALALIIAVLAARTRQRPGASLANGG
jgi:hypothetical protein